MVADNPKPVIFLAFANDRTIDGNNLRNLASEADALRKVLGVGAENWIPVEFS